MKPFAFISIMFSFLLVVSVGYFWVSKSADKSRADDSIGVKSVIWTTVSAQAGVNWYTGAVELCRTVDTPEDGWDNGGEYKGWHDCTRGNYVSGWKETEVSTFDFEKNPDLKQGDFYIHIKVLDGNGRYALPIAYHYDPNGDDLVLDSYGQTLTGDKHTCICDQYHYSKYYNTGTYILDCDSDYIPTE